MQRVCQDPGRVAYRPSRRSRVVSTTHVYPTTRHIVPYGSRNGRQAPLTRLQRGLPAHARPDMRALFAPRLRPLAALSGVRQRSSGGPVRRECGGASSAHIREASCLWLGKDRVFSRRAARSRQRRPGAGGLRICVQVGCASWPRYEVARRAIGPWRRTARFRDNPLALTRTAI